MGGRTSSRMMRIACAMLAVVAMIAAVVVPVAAPVQAFADELAAGGVAGQTASDGYVTDQPGDTGLTTDGTSGSTPTGASGSDGVSSSGNETPGDSSSGNSESATPETNDNGSTVDGSDAEAQKTPDDNNQTDASTENGAGDTTAVTPSTGVTSVSGNILMHKDVPYMAPWSAEQTQKLDVYSFVSDSVDSGKSTKAAIAKPVVVFIHGGAWINGNKSFLNSRMTLVNTLLQSGYVVASIDYRLASESPWPAQINDCKSAVRFLRENAGKYGIDAKRIAVFGESAGSHLALLMGVTNGSRQFDNDQDGNGESVSGDVQAVISDYGISDVDAWGKLPGDDIRTAVYAKNLLFGAKNGAQYTAEQAKQASPFTYVSANTAPMLLAHGKNDSTVSYQQTVMMEKALSAAGAKKVSSWYPEYGPHSSVDVFCTNITAQQRYLDFLSSVFSSTSKQDSGSGDGAVHTIPVYRFYQASRRSHLFSAQSNESTVLEQSWTGWSKEGVAFRVLPDSAVTSEDGSVDSSQAGDSSTSSSEVQAEKSSVASSGKTAGTSSDDKQHADSQSSTVTVSRMHNTATGDYIYTSNATEITALERTGWVRETTFRALSNGGIPVYRLYNARIARHILTADAGERDKLVAQGWVREQTPFHAYAANQLTVGSAVSNDSRK